MKQIKILNDVISECNLISNEYQKLNHHYIYITFFEGNKFYIGSRTYTCSPEKDIDYFGSYKDQELYNEKEKVILREFNDQNEMIFYETTLIEKYKDHPDCININSSPRPSFTPISCNNDLIKTTDLMNVYGFSSATTLSNWCRLSNIERTRIGKFWYIKNADKVKLDELSMYIKSGYSYEYYLSKKGKTKEEIKNILSEIRGV